MKPEESHIDITEDGISRRKMLKRIGAGAAVAWSAPILTSIRTPAFAATPITSDCDPNAPCDPNLPCNASIPCHNGNAACNCWVSSDHTQCWCGDLDPCTNHTPCGSNADCPSGSVCVENCCGLLCYAPCSSSQSRAPKNAGRLHGVRPK